MRNSQADSLLPVCYIPHDESSFRTLSLLLYLIEKESQWKVHDYKMIPQPSVMCHYIEMHYSPCTKLGPQQPQIVRGKSALLH